jgi:hypothetical protein
MREVASSVAVETFKAAQKKTLRIYRANPGKKISELGPEFARNFRLLKMYGLQDYATNGQVIDLPHNLESDAVRVAIHRMVDGAVFDPNGNELPILAQTPMGGVFFQLKSFPLMMQRLVREVLFDDMRLAWNDYVGNRTGYKFDESKIRGGTGNLKRAAYLFSLMPMVGYGVNSLQDVVRSRGGEDGTEREVVDRNVSKIMMSMPFWEEGDESIKYLEDQEGVDAFIGNYLSGFATAGGLGLLASMLSDITQQAENGAYGTQRMASVVGGPSVGTFFSGANVIQGILDGNENSSYPERQAIREVIQRVPVLGGQRGFREGSVNMLEKLMDVDSKKKKSKSRSGYGGYGKSGYDTY